MDYPSKGQEMNKILIFDVSNVKNMVLSFDSKETEKNCKRKSSNNCRHSITLK